MRRTTTALLLWAILAATAVLAPTGATAQDAPETSGSELPAGFTDGQPVGGTEAPVDEAPVDDANSAPAAAELSARASTTRYFGQGPWDAIEAASTAISRCSRLSRDGLTALVVAPVFKESSAATSPSTAPSPMTLSRYDEWSGKYGTDTNQNANYGLYAFRDPYTAYARAYWHPGIGIWQYDSAGVGAPYTAIERMDVRAVAGDVAAGMARRYCNPPTSVVGHLAPFTDEERRNAAWWPWWAGSSSRSCPLCQSEFDKMTASTPYFANVSKVAGITATGGAVKRTCTLAGVSTAVECWYINPSVDVIEGATGWATLSPSGNGSPTVAPAPLSKAFYVIKRNGYEERHWLKVDSGYAIDISGKRLLGKNERPRSNQTGSGVTWASSSGLCDQTAGRGSCTTTPAPVKPPTGVRSTTLGVGGTYRPVPFDATGDGRGDILWYAPGAAADYLWIGQGSGSFRSVGVSINGAFDDVIPLDADGDGDDDLLFHVRRSGTTYLWLSNGDGTFTSTRLSPGAGRQPIVLDVDGDGGDEIFWYGPGSVGDALWTWTGSGYSGKALAVGGVYTPFVGDFDRNGTEDIFWYAAGATADWLWLHKGAGGYTSNAVSVGGTYQPLVGDFDGNGGADIFWYAKGSAPDYVWFSTQRGNFTNQAVTVNDAYEPVVVDLLGDGRDDIIWNAPGSANGLWTQWETSRSRASSALALGGPHRAFVGSFAAGGKDGIFWYAPGSTPDAVWWR